MFGPQVYDLLVAEATRGINAKVGQDILGGPGKGALHGGCVELLDCSRRAGGRQDVVVMAVVGWEVGGGVGGGGVL